MCSQERLVLGWGMSRLSLPGLLPALPQDVFLKGAVLGLPLRPLVPWGQLAHPMIPPLVTALGFGHTLMFQAVTAPTAWRAWSGGVVGTGWVGGTHRGYGDSFSRTF